MAAASTSPALTSSSHTLTAAPTMAPPPFSLSDSTTNGEVLALLESLRPGNRHVFLQPSASLPTESLNIARDTLEAFAARVSDEQQRRLKESRKRKREGGAAASEREVVQDVLKLRKVYVDGFETAQVWQQAKKIITSVLDFSENLLGEMEEKDEIVANGEEDVSAAIGDESHDEDDQESLQEEDEEEDEDNDEDEDGEHEDGEQELSEDGLEGELEDDEEGDDLQVDDEAEDGEDNDDDQEGEEYIEDPHGLNDGFFSIDEFNRQTQWFEEQDARGDPNTDRASDDEDIDWDADPLAPSKAGANKKKSSSKSKPANDDDDLSEDEDAVGEDDVEEEEEDDEEEDGPTFGNRPLDAFSDDDEDDEEMEDAAMDDEGMDFNANGIYYKDFFAPPARKNKGGKPKKSVHFQPQKPTQEDLERAMADVRRDLFDDESENDDSEDALSDASAGDPKSRRSAHERRQAKLAEEIRKLEAASIAKREWTLSGEATAVDRPMNSLLEEDLDFEHAGKPVPVITPEVTEGIEDMIKRRILAQQFDEVLRRRPDSEGVPGGTRRGMVELEDGKPSKSLAELYEEEHVKKANPDSYVSASDEKLQREEREVESMWRDVCARLDALSSWHYRPKPAAASLSVVADVATVSMEDAQPATASAVAGESSRMAPQEVYKPGAAAAVAAAAQGGEIVTGGGLPVARQEMTREEKLRRRRRHKERVRKAGGADALAGKKPLSARAKMQRDTIAELKKGGVKVINRKGEITDVAGNKAKTAKVVSSGSYKL